MTRIIALSNQKGGVGKTTTTVNLGAGLVELGMKVLLVDCDPQSSLTDALGVDASSLAQSLYEVMMGTATLTDIICAVHGMHLAPATIDLEAAQVQLLNEVGRARILSDALAQVVTKYDVILLDCPPSLNVMTINALTAADEVIIPVECHYLALRGLGYLVASIQKIQQRTNPRLVIRGVLPTMLESRTSHGQDVLAKLHEQFPGKVFAPIKRTVYFADSTVAGESLLGYRSDHAGAAAYRALAAEVLR